MVKGIIIKGIGGFYYVKTDDTKPIECKARGIFRKDNIIPMVGDHVMITTSENGEGMIEEILPRKNLLIRPPVSNIDQVIIVFAISNPLPNLQLLDRFLLQGEEKELDIIICINKIDTQADDKKIEEIKEIYSKTGYPIIFTSLKQNKRIDDIEKYLEGKITVFAGPSGVGKSSLINTLNKEFQLETGEVSKKIGRGKHTTRHVELFVYGKNGFVVDTPGFSTLNMNDIEEVELMHYFPEFKDYLGKCKFNSCLHTHEPGCAVKNALERNEISKQRYNNYLYFMEELKNTNTYK